MAEPAQPDFENIVAEPQDAVAKERSEPITGARSIKELKKAKSAIEGWFVQDAWRNIRESGHGLLLLIMLLAYFAVTCIFFFFVEEWGVGDGFYYAIVVATTVGYGDFLPQKDGSKIFTVFMAHFALIIVGVILNNVFDTVAQRAAERMKLEENSTGIFMHEKARSMRRRKMITAILVYLAIVAIGTIVLTFGIDWTEQCGDCSPFVNGLYLTVITMTTIGFGDYSPAVSDELKFFGILLMLIGIPVCGYVFGQIASNIVGDSGSKLRLRLIRKQLNKERFNKMLDFVQKMRDDYNVGNYRGQGEGKISRFEYLCFMLVQNDVVEMRNIVNVMKNFDEVDVCGTGFIDINDAEGAAGRPSLAKDIGEIADAAGAGDEVDEKGDVEV